jgi:tetratricopeptide (TPR) repeat protein
VQRAIRALALLVFLLFTLFFNTNLLSVRLSELDYLLEDASGAEEVLNNSTILGRFELLKRRLEQGESGVENYGLEARIQALSAPGKSFASNSPAEIGSIVRPLRAFLNGLRLLMGKDAIHPETEDAALGALEVAYLRERSRNYRQALDEYLQVLPQIPVGTELRATALLHVAFCDAILNSMISARATLTDVISDNPGKEQSRVAWKLLDFLDFLEQKRSVGFSGKPTDLDRARQAYLLVDYATSIDLLSHFIVTHKNDPRLAEALYFRGRSNEELGELAPAIDDYHKVILYPASVWAREAQRRLFLLATIYGQGENISRIPSQNRVLSTQAAFLNLVTPYARIIDPSAVATWLAAHAEDTRQPEPPVIDSPAVSAPAAPELLQDNSFELAHAPPTPNNPTAPEAAASLPALPQASAATVTENLFLPPLRMGPNPELPEVPIFESTLPGGTAAALLAQRAALEQRHEREIGLRRGYDTASWVSLGTGVASTGIAAYFTYQAFASYALYEGATSVAQAQASRVQTQFNSAVAITAGVLGGLTLATALTLHLLAPPTAPTEDRIRALDEAIAQLGQGPRQ